MNNNKLFEKIKITESLDRLQWSEFVLNHPNGNIYQTPEMYDIFKSTKYYEPIVIAALDTSDQIVGLILAVVIKEIDGTLSSFTSRSIIQGGPLFTSIHVVKPLMEKYDEIVKKKAIYTQIRNMWDLKEIKSILESGGYTFEEHLNFLISLDRKSDDIWGDIHKSRRKGINRAEKNGITIIKLENITEVSTCYNLVKETYTNLKIPLADMSLFNAAYKILFPIKCIDFYIAIKDNKSIGVRIILKYRSLIYDWYAGSKENVSYVDEMLVWQILKENAETPNFFDFGGAGHPQKPYGVREFKKRFGGKEVNFGRFNKTHNKMKKKIIEGAFKIYRKIR